MTSPRSENIESIVCYTSYLQKKNRTPTHIMDQAASRSRKFAQATVLRINKEGIQAESVKVEVPFRRFYIFCRYDGDNFNNSIIREVTNFPTQRSQKKSPLKPCNLTGSIFQIKTQLYKLNAKCLLGLKSFNYSISSFYDENGQDGLHSDWLCEFVPSIIPYLWLPLSDKECIVTGKTTKRQGIDIF